MTWSHRYAHDTQLAADRAVKSVQALRQAELECEGFAADTATMTTPYQVYASALQNMDVPTHDLGNNAATARAVFLAAKRSGRTRHNRMSQSQEADYLRMFPNANRLKK